MSTQVELEDRGNAGWFERRPVMVPFISSIITLVVTAAVSIIVTVLTTKDDVPPLSQTLNTGIIVNLTSADLHRTNDLAAADTPVNGNLKSPLPSGTQLWVMSRRTFDANDNGQIAYASVTFADGPCRVDVAAGSFNCGQIYLGNTPHATYYVWLGLLDSNASYDVVHTFLHEQIADNNYAHRSPGNVEPVGPIAYTRG
jgi:hypothetical protein